jgi:hypothetical protein
MSRHLRARLDRGLFERWDGSKWSIVPGATPRGHITALTFTGVSCAGAACFAVGTYISPRGEFPVIERWNGRAWKIVTHAPKL